MLEWVEEKHYIVHDNYRPALNPTHHSANTLPSVYLDVVELKNVLRMASIYGNHLRQRSNRVATEQV